MGLTMLTTNATFTELIKTDTMKVGQYQIPYMLGQVQDVTGKQGQGLVGALRVPPNRPIKNILIYSLQTSNVPYNQQITMDLLNSIKSF
jgi:hypothetical protein